MYFRNSVGKVYFLDTKTVMIETEEWTETFKSSNPLLVMWTYDDFISILITIDKTQK
ncbi:hypothetical protein [Enterococcus gilvus]|uniref:hypothetical protein n=1 Tax=Enterococcus gilvus TaxID=160453 RepID=UPI0028D7FBB8|nr:hypothetical protein [Enterococcus gilvus]